MFFFQGHLGDICANIGSSHRRAFSESGMYRPQIYNITFLYTYLKYQVDHFFHYDNVSFSFYEINAV